jgi:hypothetical protein
MLDVGALARLAKPLYLKAQVELFGKLVACDLLF